MKLTPIRPDPADFPEALRPLFRGTPVFDSSSSPEARVCYLDREGGLFLKSAPSGSLAKEAAMTTYLHRKGLAAQVLCYLTEERDWLLTSRLAGVDGVHPDSLRDPRRLCDAAAEALRLLHETDRSGCPVPNRTADYFADVSRGYAAGRYDPSFPAFFGKPLSREEAWRTVTACRERFSADTLLHGDYCLPNLILRGGRVVGFIDLGNGGVGDRHIDLFWGIQTFVFNLKTDAYTDRFLDAYGRDRVEEELLRAVAAAEAFG